MTCPVFEGAAYLRAADPPFEHALDGVRPEDQMTNASATSLPRTLGRSFYIRLAQLMQAFEQGKLQRFNKNAIKAPIAVDLRHIYYVRHFGAPSGSRTTLATSCAWLPWLPLKRASPTKA